MKYYRIEFPNTNYSAIEVKEGTKLTDVLTLQNSPVLFGCYMGMCATCLVKIEHLEGTSLEAPGEVERETLEMYTNSESHFRLACQCCITAHVALVAGS